ncbi:MAG: hypothetical protein EBV19_08245 [Flavobacteriia bacterium]|nr:hypothetical protein [Flavobacteriia bacterium]
MRNVLFVFAFTVVGLFHAQGNLQFNQIVTVGTTSLTVPAGKVWKVESYSESEVTFNSNYSSGCVNSNYHRPLVINNNNYYFFGNMATASSGANYVTTGNKLPIWLKPGDQIRTVCSSDFASVIEFYIVP